MNDYNNSITAITGRIATIQSRFGVRPPVSSSAIAQANLASNDTATADGDTSSFSAMVDRLLAQKSSGDASAMPTSITDLLAAQLEQQNSIGSSIASLLPVGTHDPTVTRVQSADGAVGDGVDGQQIVQTATKYLGIPYVWGGEDTSGFDCSGLVQHVFDEAGISLPRVARDQARVGTEVASLDQALPGDLVAFGDPVDHIGIYAGNGKMVVAPHTGDVVKVQDITRTPSTIRRILTSAGAGSAVASTAGDSDGSDPAAQYRPMFRQAAQKYGISPDLLEAVAKQESRFNQNAVSPAGAQGLMQIMPATAKALGVDPFDPAQAVDGSARLLSQHLRRFGSVPLALAAYNAGPGAVTKFGGVPPYRETQGYVSTIMADLSAKNSADQTGLPFTLYSQPKPASTTAVASTSATPTAAITATGATTSSPVPTAVGSPLYSATATATTATATATTVTAAPATATSTATAAPAATSTNPVAAVPTAKTPDSVVAQIVWPTGPIVSPASGAWGPNTQMQVTSVGGENTISWGAAGLLAAASPEEVQAVVPGATGPVAKGVLRNLRNATPTQMLSREFRQTLNDVNRDALGLPDAPDVIPLDPPAAAVAPSAPTAPATAAPANTIPTTPTATVLSGTDAIPPSSRV